MNLILILILFISSIKYITSPSCIEGEKDCIKCNPLTNLCSICLMRDMLVPDDEGGCKKSEKCHAFKNHCLECEESGKLCKTCDDGDYYYPDENGACSNSKHCLLSSKGKCLRCQEDYFLIENTGLCKSLKSDDLKNCKEINYKEGTCYSCQDGYHLSFGDRKCTKTENCYESLYGICTLCNGYYYLNKKDNICEPENNKFKYCEQTLDGEKCDICDYDSFFDEEGNCVKTKYCSKSSNGECEECISGYYLSTFYLITHNKVCTNTDHCLNSDLDTNLCRECEKNYYLDIKDYVCKSNLEDNDIKHCNKISDGLCLSCESGYYLGNDNRCASTPNCEESENSICKACSENYYLTLDNYCSNVEHCIYTQSRSCVECEEGYYLNLPEKKCYESKGIPNLENCRSTCYYPTNHCCECKINFYLNSNSNQTLCESNLEKGPYYKCSFVDEKEKCYKCEKGFYLVTEESRCFEVDHCKRTQGDLCIECDDYYCLDSTKNECVLNDFLENEDDKRYFACKRLNEDGTECAECINGYTINEEGYCVNYDDCKEIKDGKCLQCNDDLDNWIFYCANDYFGCVQQGFENCTRCDNLTDLYSCTECKEGYKVSKIFGICIDINTNETIENY